MVYYWQDVHKNFTKELQQEWKNKGFKNCIEVKKWIIGGLEPTEAGLAHWLKNIKKIYAKGKVIHNIKKLREEYNKKNEVERKENSIKFTLQKKEKALAKTLVKKKLNWKDIHSDFTLKLLKAWENKGFNYSKTKEWIDIGLKVHDSDFAKWLSVEQEYTPKEVLNNCDVGKLRGEYELYNQIWLEKKKIWGIYLDEQLEEVLDLKGYDNLEKIFISYKVNKSKFEIKNTFYKDNHGKTKETEIIQLVNAQEWLEQNYPISGNCQIKTEEGDIRGIYGVNNYGKVREQIEKSYIRDKNLEGELSLSGFKNLEELTCWGNKLTSLNLNDCAKLRKLDFSDNFLITQIPFLPNPEKLVDLCVTNNKFVAQYLIIFSQFKNLEVLIISFNNFVGSLKPLKSLNKLRELHISNTDLNEGVEYLPENLEKIRYETEKRPDCKLTEIKKQLDQKYWKDIHKDFIASDGKILKNHWLKQDFTSEKTQKWIKAGVEPEDYEFVTWLRDTKKETSEWVSNYQEDYQILSDRFKKYGLCSECNQPNTGEQWCQPCNAFCLQENFTNWTSNNTEIDKFIQKYQLEATEANKFLEWIPYKRFINIEFLAEGGFGKVYKAQWKEGNISHRDVEKKQWKREKDYYHEEEKDRWGYVNKVKKYRDYKTVVLKSLTKTQNITSEFLQETANHKIIDDWFNSIVPCYSISQDPQTGNYLMVMEYIEGGDLRKYLKNKQLSFSDKLKRLTDIIQGLKDVHQKNLIHRDFHSGNILNSDIHSFITDLGLCKSVSKANEEEEIYGVLPYVAPEVLRKKGYAPASDIYSLGIVAYEIFANASPYLDKNYDSLLAIEICQGLRPDLEELKIPQLLKDLIKQCWDTNPEQRPVASEIEKTLRNWQKDAEFVSQVQAIETEYNKTFQNSTYKLHSTSIMTSKRIDTKQITKLLESQQQETHKSEKVNLLIRTSELSEKLTAEINKLGERIGQESKDSGKTAELICQFLGKSKELTKELEEILSTNQNISERGKEALGRIKKMKNELKFKDNDYQKSREQLEQKIKELTNLIKKQKEKIIWAYLCFVPEKELAQKLIIAHLEFTNAKKRELEGISKYRKNFNILYEELENKKPNKKLIQEVEIILKDCEDLVDWEIELENKFKDKPLLLESQEQISTDEPITQNNSTKQITFPQGISTINYFQGQINKVEEFISNLQIQSQSNDWAFLHPNLPPQLTNQWENLGFSPELTQQWTNLNFTHQQTKDWLNTGLTPTDAPFASYLRSKNPTPIQTLNHHNEADLRAEFLSYQQHQLQPPKQ